MKLIATPKDQLEFFTLLPVKLNSLTLWIFDCLANRTTHSASYALIEDQYANINAIYVLIMLAIA